jgi:hypothetical protein
MRQLLRVANGVLPALLMAASVALLAAGLLSYGGPTAQLPGQGPAVGGTVTPAPSDAPEPSGPGDPRMPSPTPGVAAAPSTSASSDPSIAPGPTPSAVASAAPSPVPIAVATRIVIPSEGIDLPIVSRDLTVPNQGPDRYPPCDVAIYHTAFEQPGQEGSTYIYAHARAGMFLALFDASQRRDGASLIGDLVQVYTDDNREYVYEITVVKRHAMDFSLADDVSPGVSYLVLQTSEGPSGTVPKLQILAEPIDSMSASPAEAHPKAQPRACYGIP